MRVIEHRNRAERVTPRRSARWKAGIVVVLAIASVAAGSGTTFASEPAGPERAGRAAAGTSGPSKPSPVGLTASWVPTDKPIIATPGTSVTGHFWITNRGDAAVTVDIERATALPQDNGRLRLGRKPDPRFPGVRLSAETAVIDPHATVAIDATIDVPALAPGIYLLPFIARPEVPKSQIVVVTEVSALVTLRVPGKLTEHVRAWFVGGGWKLPGLPMVQLGSSGSETLRVLDDSPATVSSFNEITVRGGLLGSNTVVHHTPGLPENRRNDTRLFFPGRHRDYRVRWEPPPLGIGFAHLEAVVSYHLTPTRLGSVVVRRDVLVIAPWWLLVLALAEVFVLVRVARRGHRLLGPRAGRPPRRREQLRDLAVTIATGLVGLLLAWLGGFGIVLATLIALALATIPLVVDTRERYVNGHAPARKRTRTRKTRTSRNFFWFAIAAVLVAIVTGAGLTLLVLTGGWSSTGPVAVLAAVAIWLCIVSVVIQRLEGQAPRRVGRRAHHTRDAGPRRDTRSRHRRGERQPVSSRS